MKKIFATVLIVIGACLFLNFLFGLIKSSPDRYYIRGNKAPLIIAHGGSKKLFPENTMPAFDGADAFSPDVMEMDVVVTKDSVLITQHDLSINRLSNGRGLVADYSLEQIRRYNFGYNFKAADGSYPYRDTLIPPATLEEVVAKYGQKYELCIELKNYSPELGHRAARQLYALLKKYNVENKTLVACFEDDILNYFRKISKGEVCTSSGKQQTKRFVIPTMLHLGNLFIGKSSALQIPVKRDGFRLDKKSLIDAAHRKNMAVHYWTINDEKEMRRLIELGADGIITDRPDIARKVLNDMRQPAK